ncbi:hypothetical protein DESC_460111 [Desulfosarcina cetonica]|nr:hypothetical protein DESC_460111 [Desulfosarcina cetonica]
MKRPNCLTEQPACWIIVPADGLSSGHAGVIKKGCNEEAKIPWALDAYCAFEWMHAGQSGKNLSDIAIYSGNGKNCPPRVRQSRYVTCGQRESRRHCHGGKRKNHQFLWWCYQRPGYSRMFYASLF